MRRAAAAEALCRAGLEDEKPEVRKLLADADPYVRLRTAMALANAGDKEGIPVLIETMPRLSLVQAWQAEDLLLRLAAGKSPPAVSVGIDDGAAPDAAMPGWRGGSNTPPRSICRNFTKGHACWAIRLSSCSTSVG